MTRKSDNTLENLLDRLLDPTQRDQPALPGALGVVRMFTVPGSLDEDSRSMRFVCSTAKIDRYSEIVEQQAFKKWLPSFLLNPIAIAGHVYVSPDGSPTTIGTWIDLKITDTGLTGTLQFLDGDDLAERYWNRYRKGVQRAVSVGFITHASEMRETEIEGVTQHVRVFTEVELIEISAVAIPANRESLVRATPTPGITPAPGIARIGDNAGGDGNDGLDQRIEAAVERSMNRILDAGPGGHLCTAIQEIILAMQSPGDGFGFEDEDDFSEHDDAPDHALAYLGEDESELNDALRELL